MNISATSLQYCSNAKEILTTIGPIIQDSLKQKNKVQAATMVNAAYIKKVLALSQANLESASPQQMNNYLQTSLMECIYQLNAVNEYSQNSKAQRGTDFMKMVHVEKMVIKI